MLTLGFWNQVSKYPKATLASYTSIIECEPNSPIFWSVDGNCSHNYNPNDYGDDIEWLFNKENLGYPPYNKNKVLEFLKRMYIGVLKLNTDYVCLFEDDCLILNSIAVNPMWEIAGHNITHGNKIPNSILDNTRLFSGRTPITDYYGAGGGTIFKSSTFIKKYSKITQYIEEYWHLYERDYYPQCGYLDCFLTIYFMLCGKDYTPNKKLYNLDPHDPTEQFLIKNSFHKNLANSYKKDYDIIHGTKLYY